MLVYVSLAEDITMSLQNSVQKALKEFEEIIPASQLKKLDEINDLFEKMVAKGLITPPSYNLEPISTISNTFAFYKEAEVDD